MKTFAFSAALFAAILTTALAVQAAPRGQPIDGYKFFEDIASRSTQ